MISKCIDPLPAHAAAERTRMLHAHCSLSNGGGWMGQAKGGSGDSMIEQIAVKREVKPLKNKS